MGLWGTHSSQNNAMYQLIFPWVVPLALYQKSLPNLTSSIFPSMLSCFVNLSSIISTLIYFELCLYRALQFMSAFSLIFIYGCQVVLASFAEKNYLLCCFFSFAYLNHNSMTYIFKSPSTTCTGNLGVDEIELIELYAHRYCLNISQ